jgi:hypothetical protein
LQEVSRNAKEIMVVYVLSALSTSVWFGSVRFDSVLTHANVSLNTLSHSPLCEPTGVTVGHVPYPLEEHVLRLVLERSHLSQDLRVCRRRDLKSGKLISIMAVF